MNNTAVAAKNIVENPPKFNLTEFILQVETIKSPDEIYNQFKRALSKGYFITDICGKLTKPICKKPFENAHKLFCHQLLEADRTKENYPIKYMLDNELDVTEILRNFTLYGQCLKAHKDILKQCKNEYKIPCGKSKIHANKFIRLSMKMVEEILKQDPGIFIIHYLRDPRGIVSSRMLGQNLQAYLTGDKYNHAKEAKYLCKIMSADVKLRKKLQKQYPQNFFVTFYEDLAQNPYKVASDIYTFINQKLPNETLNWIHKATNGIGGKFGMYTTTRKNSSEAANAWRHTLNSSLLQEITSICRDLLLDLGYPLLVNEVPRIS